jgi:hypothetical protein
MRAGLEVADVFRDGECQFRAQYGHTLRPEQRQVLRAITRCRTAELGGHKQECENCGHQRIQYNSCRNRHCPKCQALARATWLEARQAELLPIAYFHVVFTLPKQIRHLALQNKRVVYTILFRAAAETLQELAADPKHLGAQIGVLAVLHSWGQNLMLHPHVHCIVTGGGIAPGGARWIHCKRSRRRGKHFFIHVNILSRVFRGKFIDLLKQAYRNGQLELHGKLTVLREPLTFERLLNASVKKQWVVYAKRPFGGPEQVLKYLARYTHRVAISNHRLLEQCDAEVRFRYKDYADGQCTKVMSLSSVEFIRRFLMHTLPSGFVRIRYYGFLANRHRQQRLAQCRELLGVASSSEMTPPEHTPDPTEETDLIMAPKTCPACGRNSLLNRGTVLPTSAQTLRRPHYLNRRAKLNEWYDTS